MYHARDDLFGKREESGIIIRVCTGGSLAEKTAASGIGSRCARLNGASPHSRCSTNFHRFRPSLPRDEGEGWGRRRRLHFQRSRLIDAQVSRFQAMQSDSSSSSSSSAWISDVGHVCAGSLESRRPRQARLTIRQDDRRMIIDPRNRGFAIRPDRSERTIRSAETHRGAY